MSTEMPKFGAVRVEMFRTALAAGWADLRRAPLHAICVAGVYVVLGWIMLWVTRATGQSYWLVFAAIGFPLIAPFAAVAFYDVSRGLAAGQPVRLGATLVVMREAARGQLPSVGAIILIVFLIWFFLAHMIFALFLGLSTMTNVSSSWEVFLRPEGLMMLGVGSVVGAVFATLLYMIAVLSLPCLLDRDVDFMTAMIGSFAYVQRYPLPMFAWGALLGAMLLLSMLPLFLGLFIALPWLGHATWHLYVLLRDAPADAGEAVTA